MPAESGDVRISEVVKSIDWILFGATLLLVLVSLAMLFSSTETGNLLASRFIRQLIAVGAALSVFWLVVRIPYHIFRRYSLLLYAVGLSGLLLVYFAGQVIRGTTSRLELAGFQLQPSEFMKIALVVMLAWFLSRQKYISWRTVLVSAVIVGVPSGLILLEPDLGVAALLISTWGAVLLFAGTPWLILLSLLAVASAGSVAAWFWLLAEYQKDRLLVFLDPARDPLGAGYNVVQSIVALGSGYWWGRGLGHGPQSQLQFLPERHTDFILASIGEELGFIGITVILILYGIVLWRILNIARQTADPFGQLIAIGTFMLLLVSLVVSAGMNMGLLPVTGIPLPLLSYGGSNLVSTFLLLGLVQSVHVYSKWVSRPPTEISHFV